MYNRNLKLERANHDRYPFICHKIPFVWNDDSFIIPLVSHNIPPVRFKRFSIGFSLIELLVTLSVVSILAFVAVPSIKNILKDHRLSGYTNDLVADLNYARGEAVKRASPVAICKTSNPQNSSPACNTTAADSWATGRITFVDADSDGVVDSGEQVLRIRQGLDDQNSTIKGDGSAAGTANRITFKADGTSTLTAETEIALCDDRGATQKRAVAINLGGRVRSLQKGTGSITCP